MKKAQKVSRIILSVGLAVAVYFETGIFTAITALVLLLGMEAVASSVNKVRAHVLNMDRIDMRAAAEKIIKDVIDNYKVPPPTPLSKEEADRVRKQFEDLYKGDHSSAIIEEGGKDGNKKV